MRDMNKIKNQLMLQSINRWHIVPTVAQQTVADHTYGVMVIAKWLWLLVMEEVQNLSYSGDKQFASLPHILIEAMNHDMGEVGRGDIPPRDQATLGFLNKFTELDTDKRIIKLADIIEAYLTIQRLSPTEHGKSVAAQMEAMIEGASLVLLSTRNIRLHDGMGHHRLADANARINHTIMEEIKGPWDYSVGD